MIEITRPCLIEDLPEAEYHRGFSTPTESLSYSGMKDLLPPARPAHFRYRRDQPHKVSDAFDLGQTVHTLALGRGDAAVLAPYQTWATKESRQWRDEQRAAGLIPLKPGDYERAMFMQESLLRSPRAAEILCDPAARFEVSAFALDPWDLGVWLRSRFDVLHESGIYDVKTTAGYADPGAFGRKAYDFRYHAQSFTYRLLHQLITGVQVPFTFMVVEVDPPHEVSFVAASDDFDALAEPDVRRAVEIFAQCQASGEWPGYGDETHVMEPPPWAASRVAAAVEAVPLDPAFEAQLRNLAEVPR